MKKKLKVSISIPSGDTWQAEFAMCMLFLTNKISAPMREWHLEEMRIHNYRGSIIARSREKALRDALEGGFTHLLFIDSDQTFPASTLHRLIAHDKDVVACNISTKSEPAYATARTKTDDKSGLQLDSARGTMKLQEVWRVGTGIMLIKLDALRKAGLQSPFFPQYWSEEQEDYVGEDWAFCEKLEEAGISIFVDNDLSMEIGHVGTKTYRLDGPK